MDLNVTENSAAGEKRPAAGIQRRSGSASFGNYAELGTWLAGIESFLGTAAHPFGDKLNFRVQDWSNELRLTHSGLLLCADLLSRAPAARDGASALADNDREDLAGLLRDAAILSEALLRAGSLSFAEWRSWSRIVVESLHSSAAFELAINIADRTAEDSIPQKLREMIDDGSIAFSDRLDLFNVVRGFSRILFGLGCVERMLAADQPLKPALLIFARVFEDTQELVNHINHRLIRFPDEDAELFRVLDSASYSASIELRKVFDQELAGLVTVRSAVTVYARVETACATLRDGIQQTLAGIARMIRPDVGNSDIFPDFKMKFDESFRLRQELAAILAAVRAQEQSAESKDLSPERLNAFVSGPVQSLFYKDRESVERFVEEILRTPDRKDLVPILHRFGAYLETLFGHVNNRTVLADHPFESATI